MIGLETGEQTSLGRLGVCSVSLNVIVCI